MPQSVELRMEGEGEEKRPIVWGYAAKFNTESENLGSERHQFREVIAPGAFDEVLQDDVRALFNHDPSMVLARSKGGNGTLRLSVDEIGLRYEFEAPDTQLGRDLVTSLRRGDVDQSSFGFIVAEDGQTWEERQDGEGPRFLKRTITKVRQLLDVSPVTYPAYPDATVALRSFRKFQDEQRSHEDAPESVDAGGDAPTEDHTIDHWQRKIALLDKTADNHN